MKAVAFLDLLGFSNTVTRSAEDALSMLQSYNSILHFGIIDSSVNPSSSYPSELKELAKRNSTESFNDFLPFSDSIFITSENCSDFLMQLGGFLTKAFHFTAHIYAYPEDEKDPTAYHNVGVEKDKDGNYKAIEIPCRVPPALFRGGVAFGDVNIVTPSGLLNGKRINSHALMGEAVVRAVRMEKKVKGPRVLFDNSVFELLDEITRLYCRPLPEDSDFYELLWPGMAYILENRSSFDGEFTHFYDVFNPAYNLWNYYKKDKEVGVHYERFIELIIASAIKIYTHVGMRDYALQQIGKAIDGKFSGAEMTRIFGYMNVFGKN